MSDLALERVLLRDRWIVGGCLALLVALACLWLWRDYVAMARWDESMAAMGMKDMEMEGGLMATSSAPAAYLVQAFVMWLIMMVAMMLPSAAPMILLYGKLARGGRQRGGVFASTTVFAGFYLAVWGGFSALAALVQWALVRSGAISDMGLAFGDKRIGGALLMSAGLYQLTPPQNRLSREMPLAALVPHAAVAAGTPRRRASRADARPLLSWLLRDADGPPFRLRGHEPGLGRLSGGRGVDRKGRPAGTANWLARRRRSARHRRCNGSRALTVAL
jgi:predicted metal-binding membrane protein